MICSILCCCVSLAVAIVQASGLSSDLRRVMRSALSHVLMTKQLLPDNISFTVMCASTRWGRTGMRPQSGMASPDTPAAMPNSSAGRANAEATPITGSVLQVRCLLQSLS